jgi:hypothetical protein
MSGITLAIFLRTLEEHGWNWLMLVGTLLVIGGVAAIPILLFLNRAVSP